MSYAALMYLFTMVEIGNNIPCGLLTAVCYTESKFDVTALNPKDGGYHDSHGICQVQLPAARSVGMTAKDIATVEGNVTAAGRYLRRQYEKYGKWNKAVIAFNKGSSKGETNNYQRKVYKAWEKHSCY